MGLGQIDLFLSANALTNLISLAIVPASSSKKEQAHADEDVMLASPNFGGRVLGIWFRVLGQHLTNTKGSKRASFKQVNG
jgi:hypothetical protein